jgi:hypothetical protein
VNFRSALLRQLLHSSAFEIFSAHFNLRLLRHKLLIYIYMNSSINLGLSKGSYRDLADNSQSIHDGFVAEVADFPAPSPTMPIFQGHIDDLETAITSWGPPGARGSRAAHDALVTAANVVKADLKQLASYAMATKPNDPDAWRRLNFNIKRPKTAPEPLQKVRDFHLFVSRAVVAGTLKLKWKRPLDTDPGDVKGYIIQSSDTAVQPAIDASRGIANVHALLTDTSIILEPKYTGANYFWVTPFNAVGCGVSSEPLFFNNPSAV